MGRLRVLLVAFAVVAVAAVPSSSRADQMSDWESLGGALGGKPAVAAWGPGRLDVFVRGTDDALYHQWYAGTWSGWEYLGAPAGGLGADPAVVSWSQGRLDVFATDHNGQLVHRFYDNGWSGWEGLGGVLTSAPTASSWAPGRLDVFGRGSDGALYHKWYSGGWSDWEYLGPGLGGGPAAVSWSYGRIDVFVRGTDAALYHRWYDGGWSGWEWQQGVLSSNPAEADPAVSTWGYGRLDVFVVGTNETVYRKVFDGSWGPFTSQGPFGVSSSPAAASWTAGRVDLFARYNGSQGPLAHRFMIPDPPPPPPFTFGDGTWRVGTDIPPGTFRLRTPPPGTCYWERLSGFGGTIDDIIANGLSNATQVVTIAPSDAGFHSDGCGTWSSDLSAITSSVTAPFGDGTYIVGTDIAPGTWSAPGGPSCYWERLSGFGGSTGEIIANDFGSSGAIVTIDPSDRGFATDGCGVWSRS